MSEAAEDMDSPSEQNSMGPDYFGFYAREVAELLSQSEDHLPCSSNNPDVCKRDHTGSLFCDAVGAGLSDNKKERLRAILKQSVVILSQEVDEILDPVINMRRLKSWIKQEKGSSHGRREGFVVAAPGTDIADVCNNQCANCHKTDRYNKKTGPKGSKFLCNACAEQGNKSLSNMGQKSSFLGLNFAAEQEKELNEDLKILLDDVGKGRIKKHSDDLSTMLSCMQQKLEELLDIVMSTCRPMTDVEKHQLGRLIKNLPPENLSHVVEILHPRNPLEKSSLEGIDVNLEHEAIHTASHSYKILPPSHRNISLSSLVRPKTNVTFLNEEGDLVQFYHCASNAQTSKAHFSKTLTSEMRYLLWDRGITSLLRPENLADISASFCRIIRRSGDYITMFKRLKMLRSSDKKAALAHS